MTQEERVSNFLEELTELYKEYKLEVTTQGDGLLLSDEIEGGWIEFGLSLNNKYISYEE